MILAYRRGLLKPDYPNGIQSRLRERMLLQSIAADLDAEYFIRSSLLSAAVWSPHIDHKATKNVAKDLGRQLEFAMDRYEGKDSVYRSQSDIDARFMEQAQEFFAALNSSRSSDGV